MREYQSPDGITWKVDVRLPSHSSGMLLFNHPDGQSSKLDRYAWINSQRTTDPRDRLSAKEMLDHLEGNGNIGLFGTAGGAPGKFGVIAGIFEFIPNVGPMLAAIPAVDRVLNLPIVQALAAEYGRAPTLAATRSVLEALREHARGGALPAGHRARGVQHQVEIVASGKRQVSDLLLRERPADL